MSQTFNYLYHQLQVNDPPSLDDTVWEVAHIALFLRAPNRESILRTVNSPGFPAPLSNQKRNRCWLASDVRDFFDKRSKGLLPTSPAVRVDTAKQPKSIRIKN